MPPHTAVVCAAHTDLGKHVVRNLLRSAHIIRVYALSELDVRDALSNESSSSLRKLHLLTQPLDHMERTLASSCTSSLLRHADLAFYCLCTPRHAVPSLGPYLYHKLNYDLPLRFLTEMLAMPKMHSVSLLAHPCASSTKVRSQFLRVKAQLVEAARGLQQNELKNCVCRIVFHLVPTLFSQGKPPYFDHVVDHAFNGVLPRPLSKLDRIRQKAVMKHDPDAARPLLARDVAAAMVADALDSVISVSQISMITPDEQQQQQKQTQTNDAGAYPTRKDQNNNKNNPAASTEEEADLLRMQTNLFVLLQPDAIVDLARTARALRRHGGYGADRKSVV